MKSLNLIIVLISMLCCIKCQMIEQTDWQALKKTFEQNNVVLNSLIRGRLYGIRTGDSGLSIDFEKYRHYKASATLINKQFQPLLTLIDSLEIQHTHFSIVDKSNLLLDSLKLLNATFQQFIDNSSLQELKLPIIENIAFYHFDKEATDKNLYHFEKIKNDILLTKIALFDYFFSEIFGTVEDSFGWKGIVMSTSPKTYIQKGEYFETEVFLAHPKDYAPNAKVYIDEQEISVEQAIGHYRTKANKIGRNTYKAKIILTNPVTGKTDIYKKEFNYYVIEK